jgi:hypothetical protein
MKWVRPNADSQYIVHFQRLVAVCQNYASNWLINNCDRGKRFGVDSENYVSFYHGT